MLRQGLAVCALLVAPAHATPTPAPTSPLVPKRAVGKYKYSGGTVWVSCFTEGYFNWAYGALGDDPDSNAWPRTDTASSSITNWGCKKAEPRGDVYGVRGTFYQADDASDWQKYDPTECFIGNELYSTEMVFCDQACATANAFGITKNYEDDALNKEKSERVTTFSQVCGGPWYCSKTKICVDAPYANEDRKCTYVLGCANATQCTDAATGYDITDHSEYAEGTFFSAKRSTHVAVQRAGGITMKTWCCDNGMGYDYSTNLPCNAASGVFRRAMLFVAPLVAVLVAALAQ